MIELDTRDRKILELLSADAWMTYTALAAKVHLSASAVQRRVERLIDEGVLLGARARVDARALDKPFKLFVLLELTDDRDATLKRFCRQIAQDPAVAEAHYVTGEADVVLVLELTGMEEYAGIVSRHFNSSTLVRRFKTFARIRGLK